jgi:hypothetical protein
VDPFFAYDANYLIDNKAGIILDAVGTRANRAVEIAVTQTMVDRVERRFDLRPQRLAGDTAYGAVRLLKWLVDRNITPHVPVWDKSARPDGTFSRADFAFDRERNVYVCPGGAELTSTGNIDQGHIVYYRASKGDYSRCSLKPKCTTAIARKITRDLDEDVRDRVRAKGEIKWRGELVFISEVLAGEAIGCDESDDGICTLRYGPIVLGHIDSRSRLVRCAPASHGLRTTRPDSTG